MTITLGGMRPVARLAAALAAALVSALTGGVAPAADRSAAVPPTARSEPAVPTTVAARNGPTPSRVRAREAST